MSGFTPPPTDAPGTRPTRHDIDQNGECICGAGMAICREQATEDILGTCCHCHNTLANGGHEHCQRVARQALERMNQALRHIHGAAADSKSWPLEYIYAEARRGLGITDE